GPPGSETASVDRVRLQRMDRRVEARLRTLAVQSPEAADVTLRVAGDRLGEVAAGRADRADDGQRAFAPAQRLDARGALVELRQPRTEVRRVAGLARQLAEATGHLAQRLGPAAGRVGHQRH